MIFLGIAVLSLAPQLRSLTRPPPRRPPHPSPQRDGRVLPVHRRRHGFHEEVSDEEKKYTSVTDSNIRQHRAPGRSFSTRASGFVEFSQMKKKNDTVAPVVARLSRAPLLSSPHSPPGVGTSAASSPCTLASSHSRFGTFAAASSHKTLARTSSADSRPPRLSPPPPAPARTQWPPRGGARRAFSRAPPTFLGARVFRAALSRTCSGHLPPEARSRRCPRCGS